MEGRWARLVRGWRSPWTATFLLIFALLWSVAYYAAASYDPISERCEEQANHLPAEIPSQLILVVTDNLGANLGSQRVMAQMHEALARFRFSDRIQMMSSSDLAADEPPAGVHVAFVRVYVDAAIPAGPLSSPDGRMCGNEVLVELVPEDEAMVFRFTHELGHYFGLPHMEESYMLRDNKDRSIETDRFLPCQEEILARWMTPGLPYVPHWEEKECARKP